MEHFDTTSNSNDSHCAVQASVAFTTRRGDSSQSAKQMSQMNLLRTCSAILLTTTTTIFASSVGSDAVLAAVKSSCSDDSISLNCECEE